MAAPAHAPAAPQPPLVRAIGAPLPPPAPKPGQPAATPAQSRGEVAGAIAFNFFASTGIVSANKLVFNHGFHFATTLTFIHFLCTFCGLVLLARCGVFTFKRLDLRKAAKLALAGMGFVVFSNLSLQYNSVGFYQVMKHMTVVGVVIIEAVVFRRFLSRDFWGALACICVGVAITGATDFKLNLLGTVYACMNILCTSFYQIWCGSLQKSMDANPLQLQLYIAPLSALFIIPVVPLFDDWALSSSASIHHVEWSTTLVQNIALTGALALCVNISIFLLIGKTSAVTYNVVGNGKTAFLLACDFLLFGRPVLFSNVVGLAITLCGVMWYTQLKLSERVDFRKAVPVDDSRQPSAVSAHVATKAESRL